MSFSWIIIQYLQKTFNYLLSFGIMCLSADALEAQFKIDSPLSKIVEYQSRHTVTKDSLSFADSRFNHRQQFSMGFAVYEKSPLSYNAYTNILTYQIREDLVADAKLRLFNIAGPYSDIWGSSGLQTSVDAGLRYFPMNNGLFDIEARTYHTPGFNGQYVYLNFLGMRIKRLYKVESGSAFDPEIFN
jgi:hypothetical protein